MEAVPLPHPLDDQVPLFLKIVQRPDGLPEMVFGPDRLAHPPLREVDHRRMQEVPAVAEVLGLQERGRLARAVAAGAFETGFDDEHLIGEAHELPFLVQDLPVLDEGEAVGEARRVGREEPPVDDLVAVQEKRSEPGREQEHGVRRRPWPGKSVWPYRRFFAGVFFRGALAAPDRSWPGFTMPSSVMMPVMYFAGVTSNAGLRAGLSFGAIGWPSRWRTSCGDRSSIGILSPDAKSKSIVLVGAAT